MQTPITSDLLRPATPAVSFRRRSFGIAAIVSVATMPLTAIWFLVFGVAMVAASPLIVVALPSSVGRERLVAWCLSVGSGLFVGPLIYMGAALIT
jgi:hypothetical protein